MNRPKVSISVPVYNAEKYLRQSLDSLVNQTLKDIEIVIVNDGSTDNSETICREYAAKDPRIRLICKENGGLASARQAALEVSTGEYFCACDADDWVEPDMYENLYKKAKETGADIVMCDYWSEYSGGKSVAFNYGRELPNDNITLIKNALADNFPCSVWNKMFKKEIFDRHGLFWEEGINQGEDFLIHLKVLQYPVRWSYIPECLYHYRKMQNENSYTNNVTLSSYNQLLYILKWMDENLDKNLYRNGVLHKKINLAVTGLRVKEGMTPQLYKETSLSQISYFDICRERSIKSLLILITKLFGYRIGVRILRVIYMKY